MSVSEENDDQYLLVETPYRRLDLTNIVLI